MEMEFTPDRPKRKRGRREGIGMAADIMRALEPTMAGGAVRIAIPASWKGKKRSPHTYAHGNLSKKIKETWPEYSLRTRLDDGEHLIVWLERKQ
jgi:hypothetical protein